MKSTVNDLDTIGVFICREINMLALRIYLDYYVKLYVLQSQFETIPQESAI